MRIGWLAGSDDSFQHAVRALLEAGKVASFGPLSLGAMGVDEHPPYAAVFDLVSPQVPYYRSVVLGMAAAGVPVANDPRVVASLDRFVALELLAAAKIAVPTTLLIPSKAYGEQVAPEALRHLIFPVPWHAELTRLGGRGYLKPVSFASSLASVYVDSVAELLAYYDRTGTENLMIQETVPWDRCLRAFVIGTDEVFLAGFDPAYAQYGGVSAFTEADQDRARRLAVEATRTLRLDVNAVDLAVTGAGVRILDPCRPTPDLSERALPPSLFAAMAGSVARLLISLARGERETAGRSRAARWVLSKGGTTRTDRTQRPLRKTTKKLPNTVVRKQKPTQRPKKSDQSIGGEPAGAED